MYSEAPPLKKAKRSTPKRLQTLKIKPAEVSVPQRIRDAINTPQPQFTPPLPVKNRPFKILWKEKSPFALFMKFLGEENAILAIVAATNAYAAQICPTAESPRPWFIIMPTGVPPLARTTVLYGIPYREEQKSLLEYLYASSRSIYGQNSLGTNLSISHG